MTTRYNLTVRDSHISGLGLFSEEAIPIGRMVVKMIKGRKSTKTSDTIPACIPNDPVFHTDCGGIYIDTAFSSNTNTPIWYFLNHSGHPNLRAHGNGMTVKFYSLRQIEIGEELTFNYGEPDPHWH